eukprot:CAMPEP_0171320958 /NCGR_PEP_ID=MMETSP0816-20121228/108297_1 /TAXON_ID=420281 /ORGANISM="Proboscia inermis, Strain CCAP1064/1" /LENGTH=310 /DNA_ID=CAMNT_0011818383 /DNA_START=91 /DNA_END=1023 /DNA_ORIENTATION=-
MILMGKHLFQMQFTAAKSLPSSVLLQKLLQTTLINVPSTSRSNISSSLSLTNEKKSISSTPDNSASSASCDVLLFDLDGTLYSGDLGLKPHMQKRILQFLVEKTSADTGDVKFDSINSIQEARAIWEPLFRKYNQSLRGLLTAGYKIDEAEFNEYFRRGTEDLMVRDERLRDLLRSLPQTKKVIFTNAPEASAIKCLDRMGILECFDGRIYGAETMGTDCCKPEMTAFERVLPKIGINPHSQEECSKVCFFEDSYMNLLQGKKMGMQTVFLHCSTTEEEGKSKKDASELFDAVISDVGSELKFAMPSLWK